MSKQSDAKREQGYAPKVTPATCGNCRHYESTITEHQDYMLVITVTESNQRCGLGGFAVKKLGWCRMHHEK